MGIHYLTVTLRSFAGRKEMLTSLSYFTKRHYVHDWSYLIMTLAYVFI